MMKIEEEVQLARMIALRTKLDVFEQGTIDEMLLVFDKAILDINKKLKRTKSTWTKKRQTILLKELGKAYSSLSNAITGKIKKGTLEVGKKAFSGMVDILSWDGKVKDFNIPLNRATKVASIIETVPIGGAILGTWVDETFDRTLDLQRNILASNLSGQGYRSMHQELSSVYPSLTRRELITLSRTYNQSIIVATQEQLFEENRDLVKKVQWSAVMEVGFKSSGRGTCPRCAGLDGQEYELDEDRPACPLHARCRCMWVPVTKSWNDLFAEKGLADENGELITVEEMEQSYRPFKLRKETNIDLGRPGGNVIETVFTGGNYGDYITGEGKGSLSKVVGPNRARLIESGQIKFEDIVNRKTGNLFTLEELGYPIRKPSTVLIKKDKSGSKKVTPGTKKKAGFDASKLEARGYIEAGTIKAAEEIAADMGMTASFKGFRLEVANNINYSYARIKEAFPVLEKQQMHIGSHNQAVKAGVKSSITRDIDNLSPSVITYEFEQVQQELKVIGSIINDPAISSKAKTKYSKIYPAAAKLNEIIIKTGTEVVAKSVQKMLIVERHSAKAFVTYKRSPNSWGYTYVRGKNVLDVGIVVLNKIMKTTEKFFQKYMASCDSKYHPPLTGLHWERAVFTHEFGHNVDGIIRQSLYKKEWEGFLDKIVVDHSNDFKNVVSSYANKTKKSGTFELVAEAITDVMDDKGGSEVSRKIVNEMFKILEDLKNVNGGV